MQEPRSNAQIRIRRCSSVQMQHARCTANCSNVQMHECTKVQIHKCSNAQMFKRTKVKMLKCPNAKCSMANPNSIRHQFFLGRLVASLVWWSENSALSHIITAHGLIRQTTAIFVQGRGCVLGACFVLWWMYAICHIGWVKPESSSTHSFCVNSKSWGTSRSTLHLWDVST